MARGTAGYIGRGVDDFSSGGIWTIQEAYEYALDSRWPPSILVDYLVIAGGGGGSGLAGGGGGAGGYRTSAGTLRQGICHPSFLDA